VRVDKERHQAILKKFDAFIEAIVDRQTLTENVLPDVSNVRLSPEAASVLERLMAFVPPPLAEIVRVKIMDGAAQITTQQAEGDSETSGVVGTQAVVLVFWMGTPEPSREPVRKALEQMGLWRYIANVGTV
jgi:hypothetical protein